MLSYEKSFFILSEYQFFRYVKQVLTESILNFAYFIGIGDEVEEMKLTDMEVTEDKIYNELGKFQVDINE